MSKITMGNDEFILYLRKNGLAKDKTNDQLGKMIWLWLSEYADGEIVARDKACAWAISEEKNDAFKLPKTATQIEFDREKLSDLYDELDKIDSK